MRRVSTLREAPKSLVIEHAHVYTADAERHEHPDGHVVCVDGVVVAVGDGPADPAWSGPRVLSLIHI